MSPVRPVGRRSRSGLTLVEVLVALGLSSLVMVLLLVALDITRRVLRGQSEAAIHGTAARAAPLLHMVRDLESATDPGGDRPAMVFERDATGWRLRWFRVQPVAGLPGAFDPVEIEYRYADGALFRTIFPSGGDDEGARQAAGGAAPAPWIAGLEAVEPAFFDGRVWLYAWPTDERARLPHAVRVELTPEGGARALSVEAGLPAAETWTPSP